MHVISDFVFQFLGMIFSAVDFKAHKNFVLVIKNSQMVSFLLFSSFMHILCDVKDAQIRRYKISKTRS